MSRARSRSWSRGLVVAALLFVPLAARGQESAVPAERVLYRDVGGQVHDAATGAPVAGVVVSLLYETAVTDEAGNFRFEKVPLTHTAEVSIRVQSKSGLIIGCIAVDVPVRFYPVAATAEGKFDIEIVDPSAEEPVVLRLESLPGDKVNETCGTCHDSNPCVETATYEQVIQSGRDLRGIIVREDKLEEFKKQLLQQGLRRETYIKMRYQDTHPDGMNMELIPLMGLEQYKSRYRKPESLPLLEDKFVTCDTCHTRHMPAEHKQYVIMSYEDDNGLCLQCHL